MITRKHLIISVIATFFLTAAFFTITPTKSSPGLGEYDPWVDIDGDGKITIFDVTAIAKSYATSGDSTRNVNVTNWPSEYGSSRVFHNATLAANRAINVGEKQTHEVAVAGYERIVFGFNCSQGQVNFNVYWVIAGIRTYVTQWSVISGQSSYRALDAIQGERVSIEAVAVGSLSSYSLGMYATE